MPSFDEWSSVLTIFVSLLGRFFPKGCQVFEILENFFPENMARRLHVSGKSLGYQNRVQRKAG